MQASCATVGTGDRSKRPVVVVGAGVVGLSAAYRLATAGYPVEVWAEHFSPDVTSCVAGALWEFPPYHVFPKEKAEEWTWESLDEFTRLAAAPSSPARADSNNGVRMVRHVCLHRRPVSPSDTPPWWGAVDRSCNGRHVSLDASGPHRIAVDAPGRCPRHPCGHAVPDFRHDADGILAEANFAARRHGYADAWSYSAPVVDMSIYMPWLTRRVLQAGPGHVAFVRRRLRSLAEAARYSDVVVNCTAIGAAQLAVDECVFGLQGDILLAYAPHVQSAYSDDLNPFGDTYIIPRENGICVLGGTKRVIQRQEDEAGGDGGKGEGGSSAAAAAAGAPAAGPSAGAERPARVVMSVPGYALAPFTEAERRAIVERCAAIHPSLRDAPILAAVSAFRPSRQGGVRLDLVKHQETNSNIINNYGHGGAGVTVSWGCAREVLDLVSLVRARPAPCSKL